MNRTQSMQLDSYRNQQGAVLLVGLIMILMLSIIGIAAIRGSGMQELMAGNMRDRNLAFQAAEAGLRAGEKILTTTAPAASTFTCASGIGKCTDQNLTTPVTPIARLSDADFKDKSALADVDLKLANKPRYIIELVTAPIGVAGVTGDAVDFGSVDEDTTAYYRITSLGYGGTVDSQVMLQTTYRN